MHNNVRLNYTLLIITSIILDFQSKEQLISKAELIYINLNNDVNNAFINENPVLI